MPRWLFVPVAVFAATGISTVALSPGPTGILQYLSDAPFVLGLCAAVLVGWRAGDARWERRALCAMWIAVFVLSTANILAGWQPLLVYGDGNILLWQLCFGPFPGKWLGGFGALKALSTGVWQSGPIHSLLPDRIAGLDAFLMLASTTAACGGVLLLLCAWGDRLAVRLVSVAPFLLVLGPGYREYYPFIVCIYLGTIAFAIAKPLDERPAWLLGAIGGALPAIYIGFIPWASFFLAAALASHPRRWWIIASCATISGLALVMLFWPGTLREFSADYLANLRPGQRLPYERYETELGAGRSIFFRPGYVLDPGHLADLAYVGYYLGLWFTMILGGIAVTRFTASLRTQIRAAVTDPRVWLCAALLAQQTHYFFCIVPHFGPRHDLDLYFSVPVVAMFFAGLAWEAVLRERSHLACRFATIAFPAALGHGSALVTIILLGGLPDVHRGLGHTIRAPDHSVTVSTDELRRSFDGVNFLNTDTQELVVYATFFTTMSAEIEYGGSCAREFAFTQHFARSSALVRSDIAVNGRPVGSYRGTSASAGAVTFRALLEPGRNRYAISLVPLDPRQNDASARLGPLDLSPMPGASR